MTSPYIRRPSPSVAEAALQLEWAFGLNNDYKAGVHNLSLSSQQRHVFYALAHTGVLYDAIQNTQRHLLGHRYAIVSSSCCSHNHRYLVTADEGDVEVRQRLQQQNFSTQTAKLYAENEDVDVEEVRTEKSMLVDPQAACHAEEEDGSTMIVWDAVTALPLRVIATGKYGGVLSVAMSPDGQYLATLNRRDPQEIMIWSWTQQRESGEGAREEGDPFAEVDLAPVFARRIAARDEQTSVSFSPDQPELLCTNGLRRVTFWSWAEGILKYYSPPILQRRLKASIGNFTHTVYVPGTTMACSGTVEGDVVLWALNPHDRVMKEQDKTLLKMVRVHAGGVTFLTTVQGYIVTGGMDGTVKFLDSKLRLVAWFDDFNGGPVVSISFDRLPPLPTVEDARAQAPDEVESHLLREGTASASLFTAPDFMISTAHSMIIDVPAKAFHTVGGQTHHGKTGTAEVARGRLIVQGQDRPIQCLAAHPSLPRLAIGGYSGNLHLWDYCEKRVILLSLFRNLLIRCLAFDPSGRWLVVGFTNGVLKVLNAETLEEEQTLRPTGSSSTTTTINNNTATAEGGNLADSKTEFTAGRRTSRSSISPPRGAAAVAAASHGRSRSKTSGVGEGLLTSTAARKQTGTAGAGAATSVEMICFSADSQLMAVAAADGRVGLYEYILSPSPAAVASPVTTDPKKKSEWQLVGHHTTHKAAICGLHFGGNGSTGNGAGAALDAMRLLSVGADKRLIEYDLVNSSPEAGLLLRAAHKISPESVPTGFVWIPGGCSLLDPESQARDFYEIPEEKDVSNRSSRTGEPPSRGATPRLPSPSLGAAPARAASTSAKGSSRSSTSAMAAPEGSDSLDDGLDSLLIATDKYKFQVYLSNWSRQCVKTVLAPTFGGPVTRMAVVPTVAAGNAASTQDGATLATPSSPSPCECLVYATEEKVIGLAQLPLRGDPCAAIGLLAHPSTISSMVVAHDGAYVFTAGAADQSVMQWKVRGDCILPPAEAAACAHCTDKGGVPLQHLVEAVEGGARGELMKEVVDYFYYAQIRAQGEETTAKRVLHGAIPFSQMPNLVRSLGYYPSELEIGHMTYEVANMYGPKDEPLAEVDVDGILLDFSQFMRLYINYRPVYGITRQDIEAAFVTLGADVDTGIISRDHLFHVLGTNGEALNSSEIAAALTSLLGDGVRLEMLEDVITARTFAENLLGFEDYDEEQMDDTMKGFHRGEGVVDMGSASGGGAAYSAEDQEPEDSNDQSDVTFL